MEDAEISVQSHATIRAMNTPVVIGTPSEWTAFAGRNVRFFERHDALKRAMAFAFERDLPAGASEADRVVYALGKLCVEDFEEIFILAGNGRGFGALKLLRGMFERYVTALHISVTPADAQDFMDYYWVQAYRLLNRIAETLGADLFESDYYRKGMEQTKAEFERVKEKFRVPCCKRCSDTRINYTWSRVDLVSMAQKLGGGAAALTAQAYYVPLQHGHSSMASIVARMRLAPGGVAYKGGISPEQSDTALSTAHLILLGTIALQVDHFGLGKSPIIDQAFADFKEIWSSNPAA